MVVLDAEGRVIRPALLWNDTRSAGAAADLIAEFGAETLAQRTGLVPVASFTITKLRWLRDDEPENAARVAAVALPHDWLTWRLRGFGPAERVAARPGARRARDRPIGCLRHRLLEPRRPAATTATCSSRRSATTRSSRACSAPTSGSTRRPTAAGSAPAPATTPAPRSGSTPQPGDVVVSIGTSGTVFAVTEQRTIDPTGTVAGFADASGHFLPLVATLNAARVLDAIARLLGVDHDELSRLALDAEPGAGGLALVPYFEGERTPNLPDATAVAHRHDARLDDPREPRARRRRGDALRPRRRTRGRCAASACRSSVRCSSAAAPSPRRCALIAPLVLGVPVVVPEPGEYVALGAARQAARILAGLTPATPPSSSRYVRARADTTRRTGSRSTSRLVDATPDRRRPRSQVPQRRHP